jgi:hypothetical protein
MVEVIMQSFQTNGKNNIATNTKLGKKMGEKEGMYIISTDHDKTKEQHP